MKRLIVLLLIVLLLFCGCAKNGGQGAFKLEKTTANVSFAEGETMIRGELCFLSPEKITLNISEPNDVKGFLVKLENGALSFGFDGTECSLENLENLFGGQKGFQSLFEALSAAGTSEHKAYARKIKLDGVPGEAVLSLDENGRIKALRSGVYDYEFTSVQDMA
mgnify:CR=1 FL=1